MHKRRPGAKWTWNATSKPFSLFGTGASTIVSMRSGHPHCVLWGSEDIEIPRVYSDRLVAGLPHAILSVINGSGHKTCSEKPAEFNKAVLTFLLDQ